MSFFLSFFENIILKIIDFYTPLSEDKLSHFVRIYMYSKFLNQIREGRK